MASKSVIFDYVVNQVKTVKVGGSVTVRGFLYKFQTDLGRYVWPWRQSDFGEKEKFDIVLRDGPRERVDADAGEFGLGKFVFPIVIEVRRRDGTPKAAAEWLDKAITDLTVLFESDFRLGGNARSILFEQDEKDEISGASGIVGVPLVLQVTYVPGPGEA